tara:strand:+ start:189 stop:1208 length:1020 start_codon:yes stop_codon:yes gene_type:complete
MRFIKHTLFCLIIFSNTCFGKEFIDLFTVLEPVENTSNIEKSINNAFNTMIYRLSGNDSPSNIWKIINAGNSRKDFIKSYSLENFDNKSFLEVNFDKNLLIDKFNQLSIPFLGNSRPVILFLIKIDAGSSEPYILTNSDSNFDLDMDIKKYLKYISMKRGVFLELPTLDLLDINELNNYEKLINPNNFFKDKYVFDELVEVEILKTSINEWSVDGDLKFLADDFTFDSFFMKNFHKHTKTKVDLLLKNNLIDSSQINKINVSINNIYNFQDYLKIKKAIENLVTAKEITINKFAIDTVFYEISTYGDIKYLIQDISSNNFFEILDGYENKPIIGLSYKR